MSRAIVCSSGGKILIHTFCSMSDGTLHTTCIGIAFECKAVPSPTFPCFEQGMGQQRQCTRLITDIPQDQIHKSRFKGPMATLAGSSMARRSSSGHHRADVFLLLGHGLAQVRDIVPDGRKNLRAK